MALTRLRPVAGDAGLGDRILDISRDAIAHGKSASERTIDILDMRNRLMRERPARGDWDLKLANGGLVDLEFILQHAMLTAGETSAISSAIPDAIQRLQTAGKLSSEDGETIAASFRFLQSLQQVQRLATGADLSHESFSSSLRDRLCRATAQPSFEALTERLQEVFATVAALRCKKIGPLATES